MKIRMWFQLLSSNRWKVKVNAWFGFHYNSHEKCGSKGRNVVETTQVCILVFIHQSSGCLQESSPVATEVENVRNQLAHSNNRRVTVLSDNAIILCHCHLHFGFSCGISARQYHDITLTLNSSHQNICHSKLEVRVHRLFFPLKI